MILLKKLALAPVFLIIFITLLYQLNPLLSSYEFIFSLSLATLIQLIIVSVFFSLSSLSFILFATLADDWKLVLPVAVISALLTFVFVPPALAVVLAVAFFVSFLLTFLSLNNSLKGYLTFEPNKLLGPSARHLSSFLILAFCLVYFFSSSKMIAQKGFELPDSLIDTALKVASPQLPDIQNVTPSLPTIPQDQLEMLKKNPELLKQYGVDPKMLDSLSQPKSTTQNQGTSLIKQAIKNQVEGFIKPYINFIAPLLTVLLFFTLQSIVSLVNLLIYPLLWLAFLILQKTGFVKFEIEMREVKKLVV